MERNLIMPQTTLSVRMDEELKKKFDDFCSDVGLNASVAINLFVKAVVRENRIPFEITNQPTAKVQAAIRAAEKDLERGRLKEYASPDELMKDLLK